MNPDPKSLPKSDPKKKFWIHNTIFNSLLAYENDGRLSQMEDKGTAAELCKTKIPLKTAREQVLMNKRSLIRVLALAKINTESPPPLPWATRLGSSQHQGTWQTWSLPCQEVHRNN
jgi:hypothetical protein